MAIKKKLMPAWLEARKAKKARTYWRGCHLFVGGEEVKEP